MTYKTGDEKLRRYLCQEHMNTLTVFDIHFNYNGMY